MSANRASVWQYGKYWLNWCQYTVSEWSDISTYWLCFSELALLISNSTCWSSTNGHISILSANATCFSPYIAKKQLTTTITQSITLCQIYFKIKYYEFSIIYKLHNLIYNTIWVIQILDSVCNVTLRLRIYMPAVVRPGYYIIYIF